MSDEVKVAVVGVGFVGGQAHTPSFKKIDGSNLVALCARTERRVKPLAEKYEVKYYLDYDDMLEKEELNAVVLSVPTPLHYDMAMKAIDKGMDVLCEMPIAPTLDQVRQLKKAAEEKGVLLMPILNFRFAPIYIKTKEMLHEGVLGKPIAIHYREFLPAASIAEQWPAESWAWNIDRSGGYPDFTLSVWSLDMIMWMFSDKIKDIRWMSSYPKLEEFGGIIGYNTMGVLKFFKGIVGTLHFGASVSESASTTRLEVYGDNTNVLHAIWNNKIILYGSEPKPKELDLDVRGTRVWGHRQIDTHFINCILHGEKPEVTVDDAIKAQETAQKIVTQTR